MPKRRVVKISALGSGKVSLPPRHKTNTEPSAPGERSGIVIAIDGRSAAGKSTTAHAVAYRLGFVHLKSGEMFRALAWECYRRGIDLTDMTKVIPLLSKMRFHFRVNRHGETVFLVNGRRPSDHLRDEQIGNMASLLGKSAPVQEEIAQFQRWFARKHDVVVEGRNTATHVFPNANLKFWITARLKTRAGRRFKEVLKQAEALHKHLHPSFEEILQDLLARDRRDQRRKNQPTKKAADAIVVNTDRITVIEGAARILAVVAESPKIPSGIRERARAELVKLGLPA